MGRIYFARNQFAETIHLLNRGIERGIRHPAVYSLLGRALESSGQAGKALEQYDRVLELQPNYPDANCRRAILFLNNKQYPEALCALEREIEIGGNLVAAYNLLGEMSLFWNDSESARNFFLKVLTIEPDNPTAKGCLERIGPRNSVPPLR